MTKILVVDDEAEIRSLLGAVLRTDYTTLHAKMKRYSISARDFMPR